MKLSPEVLKRRVFNQAVNDALQAKTIMGALGPYIDKNRLTVDVGGATGHFTTYFAPRSRHVHAFEAVPEVWMQLRKKEDEFVNVTAHNKAVGDVFGKSEFFVDDKRLSNSGYQDLVGGPKITVDSITLDRFLRDEGQVGFIKIDVEGTEKNVLDGARQIIQRDRPNLLVEIYEPFCNCPVSAIFAWLMAENYMCYYYDHPNLVRVPSIKAGVDAVMTKHKIHDGDFLFVNGENDA